MRIKRKNGLKIAAITIALLLCLALAVGITGAWYQAKRQATGTLSMDQGIIIDYKGFGQTPDEGIWSRDTTTTFLLFDETNAQPGQNIPVNAAGIRANENSVNFYARVKLEYKFYNGETPVELADATKLIKTSSDFFGTNWVDGGGADGYYYYATGSTLNKFEKGAASTTSFVELFATDAKFIIEGAGFTGANNNGEGGGFKIDETTSINKIEVYLTLETLQGDATAEQAKALGWEITTGVTEDENVVELTPEDYTSTTTTDDETGEEKTIYTPSETFVGKNSKYAFTFSLNDTDKTATITGPVGNPTELDIPCKLLVNDKSYITKNIGDSAFTECESLTSIKIPNSITSIEQMAFYYCRGLESITIPNSVTSIEYLAFGACINLESIEVQKENEKYYSVGNCLIERANKTLIFGCKNSIIPTDGSLTSIGIGAFYGYESLTLIDIPDKVTSIRNWAFTNCSSLTSITIPNSVTSIGQGTFANCSSLTSITIPNSVTLINLIAFSNCTSLKTVVVGAGINFIHTSVFEGCTSLVTKLSDLPGTWVKEDGSTIENYDSILLKDINFNIKKQA